MIPAGKAAATWVAQMPAGIIAAIPSDAHSYHQFTPLRSKETALAIGDNGGNKKRDAKRVNPTTDIPNASC